MARPGSISGALHTIFAVGFTIALAPTARGEAIDPTESAEAVEVDTIEPTDAYESARVHFEQGMRLVRREQWAAALAEFDESLRHHPTGVALFNRGLCLKQLGRYVDSLAVFEEYLEQYSDEMDEERRANIERMVGELHGLLAEVTITVNVPGATIDVDGEEVGVSPLDQPLRLLSGPHDVSAALENFETARQRFVVVIDGDNTIELELRALPRGGRLQIESNVTGARVLIDGEEVGRTPYEGFWPEGEYEVEVSAEGYRHATQTVTISQGDHRIATVSLERPRRIHRAYFWSALAVNIASTLTTVGLGAAVTSLDQDYDYRSANADAQYSRGRTLVAGTDAAFGIACVSGAAALVLAFFTDWHPAQQPSSAIPLQLSSTPLHTSGAPR